MRSKDFFLILLIFILAFPAIKTLLIPGFFETHDGKFHLVRLAHFYQTLKEGHFPVRWAEELNYHYGYPIFNFFYPGLYYFTSLLYLGFTLGDSLKIIIFLSFILSGIFTYSWLKEFFGRLAAFISAIFYIYAPYRFVSSYVSGRMGEVASFIFIPLCFYSLTRFVKKQKFSWLVLASFSYALLILFHHVSALIFSPLILSYLVFLLFLKDYLSKKSLLKFLVFIILSYSLSAFFWVPAFFEKQYIRFSRTPIYDYQNNFPSLKSYLYHPWGYGFGTTGVPGGVSPQIGIGQIFVSLLTLSLILRKLFLWKKKRKRIKKEETLACFFLFWFTLVFCLMNQFSQPLWEIIPFIKNIQFPFRFLSVIILLSSFFAGYLIYQLKNKKTLLVICSLFLVTLVLYANRNHLNPGFFDRHPDSFYLQDFHLFHGTSDVAGEALPIWNKEKLAEYEEKIIQEEPLGKISHLDIKPRLYSFQTGSNQEIKIRVNTLYYPGWQVLIDGKKTKIDYQNREGLIKFKVPPGNYEVIVRFEETSLRKIANLLSLISFTLSLFLILKPILKRLKLAQKNLAKRFLNARFGVL